MSPLDPRIYRPQVYQPEAQPVPPEDSPIYDPATIEAMVNQAYPRMPQPVPTQSPNVRFGPLNLSGNRMDSAALALLQALQQGKPGRGFGANFASGLAQGAAGSRVRQAGNRMATDEQAQQDYRKNETERKQYAGQAARDLATHRWQSYRDQQKGTGAGRQMFTLPDGTQVPMTAALANGLAGKQGVIPQRADVSVRPKVDPQTLQWIESVADAAKRGDASPDINDYGRDSNVRLALSDAFIRRGMNPRVEGQKYNAEKVFLRSANGTIALRGMRNVVNARESLDYTEQLLDESLPIIKRSPLTPVNRFQMLAAAEGTYGPEAAAVARKLKAQVAAVRFELSNIYMGGTAPTDQAVKKAMDVIDSNWSEAGLRGAITLARRDLGIRVNAIKEVGPISLDNQGGVQGAPNPVSGKKDSTATRSGGISNGLKFLQGGKK